MSKIDLSIIVPVYNVKDYLEDCLKALLNQTISNYEIILVNDGSTDGSDDICKEYAKQNSKIKYLTQHNQGQSAARNYGLSVSNGEYVMFVDADDYIVSNACLELHTAAKRHEADIVVGDIINERERVYNDPSFRWCPAENACVTPIEYARYAVNNGMYDIVPWIRIVKKEYLIEHHISFLEGCYYEDHEYSMKLFSSQNGRVLKVRFPFYYYRMDRAGSTTNIASSKKGNDFLRVIDTMQKETSENGDIRDVQFAIIGIAYYHYVNLWMRLDKKDEKVLFNKFLALASEYEYSSDAINTLPRRMRYRVEIFMHFRWLLQVKHKVATMIK